MLSLFKEKLLSVQDGIASSLKGVEKNQTSRKDFNAGAKLLAKYQGDWEELHTLSEENAKNAVVVDKQIGDCYEAVKKQRFAIKKFNYDVADLSSVMVLTEKAVNAIGNIRSLIEEIQDEVIVLEDLVEQEEHLTRMAGATNRLKEFRKEQLISLDALRERLAEDYNEKVKILEEKKAEEQKKNFEIAEKQFLEDFKAYKETGELPKKETVKASLSIEDVEIEQDLDSFQEYLKS